MDRVAHGKLTPQLAAIMRVLWSHYPDAVSSEVLWERLHWISKPVLKAQMWQLRQRLDPGWRIVSVRGSGRSYRLVKDVDFSKKKKTRKEQKRTNVELAGTP